MTIVRLRLYVHNEKGRVSAKRQSQQTAQAQQIEQQSSQAAGRLKSRVITGQSSALSSSIWAAKKTIKKAVLCVDNVSLSCDVDDIRAHVSNFVAEVFTCFKTNPRRRPNESAGDVTNRRAFRLCVNAADREIACLILLSGRIWYVSQIGFSPTNALKKATVIMGNDSVLTDLVSLESRSHCSALLIMIITTLLKLKTQVVTLALQAPCVRKQLLLTSLLSPM